MIAHGSQLFGVVVARIRCIVDSFRRPYADEAICKQGCQSWGSFEDSPEHVSPPAAVTSLDPSGETWQLYTSKSFFSPLWVSQTGRM